MCGWWSAGGRAAVAMPKAKKAAAAGVAGAAAAAEAPKDILNSSHIESVRKALVTLSNHDLFTDLHLADPLPIKRKGKDGTASGIQDGDACACSMCLSVAARAMHSCRLLLRTAEDQTDKSACLRSATMSQRLWTHCHHSALVAPQCRPPDSEVVTRGSRR